MWYFGHSGACSGKADCPDCTEDDACYSPDCAACGGLHLKWNNQHFADNSPWPLCFPTAGLQKRSTCWNGTCWSPKHGMAVTIQERLIIWSAVIHIFLSLLHPWRTQLNTRCFKGSGRAFSTMVMLPANWYYWDMIVESYQHEWAAAEVLLLLFHWNNTNHWLC